MKKKKKTRKPKFTIKKHVLVPVHKKLNEVERKKILEKYNITIKELPSILIDDSAIADLNVKEGDVIKVIRKSPTAGETIFYRSVVNA